MPRYSSELFSVISSMMDKNPTSRWPIDKLLSHP
jgi:hypothetical protein